MATIRYTMGDKNAVPRRFKSQKILDETAQRLWQGPGALVESLCTAVLSDLDDLCEAVCPRHWGSEPGDRVWKAEIAGGTCEGEYVMVNLGSRGLDLGFLIGVFLRALESRLDTPGSVCVLLKHHQERTPAGLVSTTGSIYQTSGGNYYLYSDTLNGCSLGKLLFK